MDPMNIFAVKFLPLSVTVSFGYIMRIRVSEAGTAESEYTKRGYQVFSF